MRNEDMDDALRLPEAWSDWELTELLGAGSYGAVYKAERRTGDKTEAQAVKVIELPPEEINESTLVRRMRSAEAAAEYLESQVQEYLNEIRTMYSLRDNPHIVQIYDHLVVSSEDRLHWTIYIRMELLRSLTDYYADRFGEADVPEEEAVKAGLDLCDALIDFDRRHMIHRDIKTENILVSAEGVCKLGDFGTARQLDKTFGTYSVKGSYSYMAPEVYKGERYSKQVDIYSLGMVLYHLMNKDRDPFVDLHKRFIHNDQMEALERRMDGEPLPPPVNASPAFASVILKATAYLPKNRYEDAAALKRDLERVIRAEEPEVELTEAGVKNRERRRRRRRRLLIAAVIALCSGALASFYVFYVVPRRIVVVSAEDVKTAANELITRMAEDAGNAQRSRFAGYFRNTPEKTITDYYADFTRLEQYPARYISVLSDELTEEEREQFWEGKNPSYFINIIFYNPQQVTEDGKVDSIARTVLITKTDGAWRLDSDPERMAAARTLLAKNSGFPDGFYDAIHISQSRGAMDGTNDYMFLDKNTAYDNLIVYFGKFMWRNADESVGCAVWLANGSSQALSFGEADLTMTDQMLGKIFEKTVDLDTVLQPGTNTLVTFTIPPGELLVSGQDWTDTTLNVTLAASPEVVMYEEEDNETSAQMPNI